MADLSGVWDAIRERDVRYFTRNPLAFIAAYRAGLISGEFLEEIFSYGKQIDKYMPMLHSKRKAEREIAVDVLRPLLGLDITLPEGKRRGRPSTLARDIRIIAETSGIEDVKEWRSIVRDKLDAYHKAGNNISKLVKRLESYRARLGDYLPEALELIGDDEKYSPDFEELLNSCMCIRECKNAAKSIFGEGKTSTLFVPD